MHQDPQKSQDRIYHYPSKDMSKVSMLNIGCFFKSSSQTVQEGIIGTRGISRPRGAQGRSLEFDRVMGDFTSPPSAQLT